MRSRPASTGEILLVGLVALLLSAGLSFGVVRLVHDGTQPVAVPATLTTVATTRGAVSSVTGTTGTAGTTTTTLGGRLTTTTKRRPIITTTITTVTTTTTTLAPTTTTTLAPTTTSTVLVTPTTTGGSGIGGGPGPTGRGGDMAHTGAESMLGPGMGLLVVALTLRRLRWS